MDDPKEKGMKNLIIYEYKNCSTCKNALKFLDQKGISYERRAIVDNPPTKNELKRMLKLVGGNIRKLFNTSGLVYKEMKLGEKLDSLSTEQALELLSQNGKLVKRPFVLTDEFGVVGFKTEEWKKIF